MGIPALFIAPLALLGACASSTPALGGHGRAPISPADVKIYSVAPPRFEEVAILSASSKSVFAPGGQRAIDKVVARLRQQAAKLGANGVILEGFTDEQTGSLGTGVGNDSYTHNSSISVGVGGSVGIFKKSGQARAIYVAPSS